MIAPQIEKLFADGDGASELEASASHGTASFWVGPENRLLKLAVQRYCQLLQEDHQQLNGDGAQLAQCSPLVIWGAGGSGKSHVVHALVQWWNQRWPQRRAMLDTALDFGRAYREAAQMDDLESFREKLDTAQLLVLEDIHRIVDQNSIQTELVRILDERTRVGLPTVCTSLDPDSSRSVWAPQLSSRMVGGLTVRLQPATVETRRHWLVQAAEALHLVWEPGAAELLAERQELGFRQLTGALTCWQVERDADGDLITLERVRCRLQHLRVTGGVSLIAITRATAQQCRLRVAEIRGKSRRTGIMRARSLAMYLARQCTSLSLQSIGEYFSGRDHTTVIHACRKVELMLEEEPSLKAELEEIRRRCAGVV